MRTYRRRALVWLMMMATGGSLFQGYVLYPYNVTSVLGGGGSCQTFGTNLATTSVDFCFVFDCDNGFFGGVVQPCGDPLSTIDDMFIDCTPGLIDDETP